MNTVYVIEAVTNILEPARVLEIHPSFEVANDRLESLAAGREYDWILVSLVLWNMTDQTREDIQTISWTRAVA